MSSYLDMYRQRVFADGKTAKDRIENHLSKDFKDLLKTSPNRVEIEYDSDIYSCILASGNSRAGTQTERKVIQYLHTDKSLKIPEGGQFTIEDSGENETTHWLVLHREIHPYYGYFKYKVIELDYMIKYVDRNGQLKEIPAYVNGTGEFDIKEYFRYVEQESAKIQSRALNLIFAANDDFESDLRVIIGDEAWRYIDSDKISIPGVYFATFDKTTVDHSSDAIEDKIADVDNLNIASIISNYGASKIEIGLQNTDLQFFYMKDGKICRSSMEYLKYDESVLAFEGGKLTPLKEGETDIYVIDKISGMEKNFHVTVKNLIENYFHIVGSFKFPIQTGKTIRIFTDLPFEVEWDKDFLEVERTENILKVTTLSKIGKTKLTFVSPEKQVIATYEIEVTSLWV